MLDRGATELLVVFKKLSTTRAMGMTIGPIGIDKIWHWEERTGIDDPLLQRHLESILLGVDGIVCKRLREKAEANRPRKEKRGR